MLTIRRTQLQRLGEPLQAAFEARMLERLRTDRPARHAALGDAGLLALVRQGIASGRANGLEGTAELAQLIGLVADFGPAFERSPDQAAALALLQHPGLPPELKIHLVAERLYERTGGRAIVFA